MGQIRSIHRRDRGNCHLCGWKVSLVEASRDHLRPRSAGGYDKAKNYALAHALCNSARGALPMEQVRAITGPMIAAREHQMAIVAALREAAGAWQREHPPTVRSRLDGMHRNRPRSRR